uniref:Secreted protein n=1 Tax=Parastrongyloides trichosuri TaxID=131310 RepID=A0A0N4ZBB5_PARTI
MNILFLSFSVLFAIISTIVNGAPQFYGPPRYGYGGELYGGYRPYWRHHHHFPPPPPPPPMMGPPVVQTTVVRTITTTVG